MGDPNWFKNPPPDEEPKKTKRQRLKEWARAERDKLNADIIRLHEQKGSASDEGGLTPQEETRQEQEYKRRAAEWDAFMKKDLPPALTPPQQLPEYTEEELKIIAEYEKDKASREIPGEAEARERVRTMPQDPRSKLKSKDGRFIFKEDVPKGVAGSDAPTGTPAPGPILPVATVSPEGSGPPIAPVEPTSAPEGTIVPKAVIPKKKAKAEPVPIELTVPKSLKTEVDAPPPTALNVVEGKVEHFGEWVPLTQEVKKEKLDNMQLAFDRYTELRDSATDPQVKQDYQKELDKLNLVADELEKALPEEVAEPEWTGDSNRLLQVNNLEELFKLSKVDPTDEKGAKKLAAWLKGKSYEAIEVKGHKAKGIKEWLGAVFNEESSEDPRSGPGAMRLNPEEEKIYYRGEAVPVSEYDLKKLGTTLGGPFKTAGIHWTDREDEAQFYARARGTDIVNSANLDLKNPYPVDDKTWSEIMDWGSLEKQKYKTLKEATKAANAIVKRAKELGHDGLTYLDAKGVPREFVVFDPKQVRLVSKKK